MKKLIVSAALVLTFAAPSWVQAQEKKAKAEKATGDIGLLDTEKNYLILVTKEGKLITIDFNDKTKVTKYVPEKTKMSEINLGQSATISYKKQGDKNIIDDLQFQVKAKKGE
jgi:hypothetical protein